MHRIRIQGTREQGPSDLHHTGTGKNLPVLRYPQIKLQVHKIQVPEPLIQSDTYIKQYLTGKKKNT